MTGPSEKDIKEIRWRVEGIDGSVDLLVRANRKQILSDLIDFFGRSKERVRVFLEIDGQKSVEGIVKSLQIGQPHVSRRITELKNEGLIELASITEGRYIYRKTSKVNILGLDSELRKTFKM
jgi:predicted transcriptional regulator